MTPTEQNRKDFTRRVAEHEMPSYVYTYPHKGAYRRFTDRQKVRESWAVVSGPINLYIHVPYCHMKCSFCSLLATTSYKNGGLGRYVSAVEREIDLAREIVDGTAVEVNSVYLGGGTPTVLTDRLLSRIMGRLEGAFRFHADAEIAIEAAPNSIDDSKYRELRRLGFDRISLGIQSFDDRELSEMGRRHDGATGRRMLSAALEAGFPNVNCDLIYGLPEQGLNSWLRNLEIAVELGLPTVTLYPLVVRNRTAYGKQRRTAAERLPGQAARYEWYDLARQYLLSRGYTQHTLVTFARDGGGCRHEANEFAGIPTLGFGAGTRSYAPTLHYTNDNYVEPKGSAAIIKDYIEDIEAGVVPVRSAMALNQDEVIRRYVILRLLHLGIDRQDYEHRFAEPIKNRFGAEFKALESERCLVNDATTLMLSPRGKRFSSLIADLLTSEKVKALCAAYDAPVGSPACSGCPITTSR